MQSHCPSGATESIKFGDTVHFPAERCDDCTLRNRCTASRRGTGRSVQGRRSRYMGARKNLFDLRRAAIIQNLEITQRMAA